MSDTDTTTYSDEHMDADRQREENTMRPVDRLTRYAVIGNRHRPEHILHDYLMETRQEAEAWRVHADTALPSTAPHVVAQVDITVREIKSETADRPPGPPNPPRPNRPPEVG